MLIPGRPSVWSTMDSAGSTVTPVLGPPPHPRHGSLAKSLVHRDTDLENASPLPSQARVTSPQPSPERNTSDALRVGGGRLGQRRGAVVPSQSQWSHRRTSAALPLGCGVAQTRGKWPWLQPSQPSCPPWISEFPNLPSPPLPAAAGLLEASGVPELIKNSCTLPLNGGHHSFVPGQWGQLTLLSQETEGAGRNGGRGGTLTLIKGACYYQALSWVPCRH